MTIERSGSDTLCERGRPLVGGGDAMPKEIKGNAGRRPPQPSADHSEIDEWFRRQVAHLQPIVQALDEAIRFWLRCKTVRVVAGLQGLEARE
jgi:hypothetical protein